MVKMAMVRGMKIWSVEGKVTIAKCVKTGRFVKRTLAQKALNNVLMPIVALPANDSPFLQYASFAASVVMVSSIAASVMTWLT